MPWIGEIPAGWKVAKLGYRYSVTLGKMLNPDAQRGIASAPYLRNQDVQWDRVRVNDLPEMDFDAEDRARLSLRPGDLLVCEGGEVGRTAEWKGEIANCYFQKAIHRVRPRDARSHPRFLLHMMRAASGMKVFLVEGNVATIPHLTAEKLYAHRFPHPPVSEQRAIADMLDDSCARIDAAIAAKEALLAKLAEQRLSTITHAVTRGLDPVENDAPPAHWRSRRFKFLLRRMEQGWSPQCEGRVAEEDEWGVLKVGCVNGGRFDLNENKALPADLNAPDELRVSEGELLMSRANTRELVGGVALAVTGGRKLLLCDKLYRLELTNEIVRAFAMYFWSSGYCRGHIESHATGASSSMLNIGQEVVREIRVHLPPLAEQEAIADFLDAKCAALDAAMEKIRRQVELLRAYRQSVITAYVTGKIAVPPSPGPVNAITGAGERTEATP